MTEARAETFAAIRAALGVTGREADRRAAVAQRLALHPSGPIPARGHAGDRAEIFRAEAERAGAVVVALARREDAPVEIARLLAADGLAPAVRAGADERLTRLPWANAGLTLTIGPSDGGDLCAVSCAFAAIAETGTLALVGGPDNPTTLNFLPDDHIVLIARGDIDASFEDLFARLRAKFGSGSMPATLNLVTGPSRSADIEQTMLLGAHGPRRLRILLIDDD